MRKYSRQYPVPTYVVEFLLGRYCATTDPDEIAAGLEMVQASMQERTVRAGEEELFKHRARDKSRVKILYQLEKTRRKIERETLRRDARAAADARYLACLAYPHRHLQERFYSILPFLAQHGLDLVDRLYDSVQLDCPDHRVLII